MVIEDEAEIRELIKLHLLREGHSVVEADSAEAADLVLSERRRSSSAKGSGQGIDVLIVDWMLPGQSGVDFVRRTRHASRHQPEQVPDSVLTDELAVLMVTAKADAANVIHALEAGADDYLVKPFDSGVLLARVRALLRRQRPGERSSQVAPSVLKVGGIVIDSDKVEVTCAGQPLQLTVSEFKLLLTLMRHHGRVLTREALVAEIQGAGVSVIGRTIDTHVFGLRKKLGPCSEAIETVRGIGYRIKPD